VNATEKECVYQQNMCSCGIERQRVMEVERKGSRVHSSKAQYWQQWPIS